MTVLLGGNAASRATDVVGGVPKNEFLSVVIEETFPLLEFPHLTPPRRAFSTYFVYQDGSVVRQFTTVTEDISFGLTPFASSSIEVRRPAKGARKDLFRALRQATTTARLSEQSECGIPGPGPGQTEEWHVTTFTVTSPGSPPEPFMFKLSTRISSESCSPEVVAWMSDFRNYAASAPAALVSAG